ncbi:MAG: flagellar hook-basal body complex protein FliE [Gammaproteobacteria bacterium]|nr:MAG: flagellar hook-basal body complex protein FliE [Gammaproteobacteria bacterium]
MSERMDIQQVLGQLRALAAQARGEAPDAKEEAAGAPDFAQLLQGALEAVNERQQSAQALAQRFQAGDGEVALTDVMIELQKARVAFQAMVTVRDKLVSAYREIMSMQV